jgi:hypothetical protein
MLLQGCYGQKQGSTDANSALHSPNRLGPYQALLTLAVPLAIVEPLKLVALFVVGGLDSSILYLRPSLLTLRAFVMRISAS